MYYWSQDVHFEEFRSVNGNSCPLSNNFTGLHKILEDLVMDGGEGTAAGALLHNTGSTSGLAQDSALANEDDMAVGELLLELSGQPI